MSTLATIFYVAIALGVGFVLGVLFRSRAVELAKRETDALRAKLSAKIKG